MPAQVINAGPGARTRKTKVSRLPFWKPQEKEWIYLPVDSTHNQQVLEQDEEGNSLGSIGVYEAKGWKPLRQMVDDEKAMAKLPTNWRDVAHRKVDPIFAEPEVAEPVPAAVGDGKF